MPRLQTSVESLSLLDGQRQAGHFNVRSVEPVSSSPQAVAKGNLYVLLELGGDSPASTRLYRLLVNTIQGVYYDAAGGITGGLTEAILAAHQALLQHNAVYPDEAQLGGVSCVVLRGEELHLGVGGPAMVLVGQPGRVDQFPAELSADASPLGGADAPAIEIFRTAIDQGTMVIQLASEWVARVPARKLAATALAPDLPAALEYLEALAPAQGALTAVAIHLTRAPVEAARPVETERSGAAQAVAGAGAVAAPYEEMAVDQDGSEDWEAAGTTTDEDEALAAAPEPASETALTVTPVRIEARAQQPARRSRWPWLLVLLLPVAVVALIAIGLWLQQRSLQQQFQSLMDGAQAALQAAGEQGIPEVTAREQLNDAQERVQEALTLFPDDAQAISLQTDIQARMDEVNRIVPLYKLITLQPLGGSGSDPAHLVVEGSRMYLQDQGTDQVVRFGLDEISGLIPETSGGVVAQRGQQLPDGQLVGELLDMTFAQAGGERRSSNLLILDSNRNLLELDNATGLTPLAVAAREQWQDPRAIASFNGNLYVIDAGQGKILRYRPTADGYSTPPENYLEGDATLDLSRAVDMAIDGSIWILYRDGTVQTFLEGRQQPFVLEPPPNEPITQPQAIFAGSEAGTAQTLFIVDSGGGRVLEYDKNGTYLRQYRPADKADLEKLRKMRDLQVDEVNRAFYILTSDGLYRTDIPGEQG